MQIDNEVFEHRLTEDAGWDGQVFRYCTFRAFDAEGPHITSEFIDCLFEGCELYWALFNNATLVGVTFKHCRFRGCSFAGCRVVECTFENCDFTEDNLGGSCSFEGSRWYGCQQRQTNGLSVEWVAEAAAVANTG